MFENIFSNFKTRSSKVSDSFSVAKISDSFSNIRCNLMHKTNSLSSYFSNTNHHEDLPISSASSPDLVKHNKVVKLNKLESPNQCSPNYRQEYIHFNPIADEEYEALRSEDSIVDRFVRVINIEDDKLTSLSRQYSFRRRNDREEIRKRLATGCDPEEYFGGDRPGRKPSLQARLQSGMNLQICFMNDTMSDTESPGSDSELGSSGPRAVTPARQASPLAAHPAVVARGRATKQTPDPPNNNAKSPAAQEGSVGGPEADLAAAQAQARAALAQAADLARLQMDSERQRRQTSPITLIVRNALRKAGVELSPDRRRVTRQMLTDMNLAQLQVIVNELHTQIEHLNEGLVEFLMERDDLHMGQDSMLVDIEDLTRYIGAKEDVLKEDLNINNNVPTMKPKPYRMAAMRK